MDTVQDIKRWLLLHGWHTCPATGRRVTLGDGVRLGDYVTLGDYVRLGDGVRLGDEQIECLGRSRRGYEFLLLRLDVPIITAGCRWFTLNEAKEHWANAPDEMRKVRFAEMILQERI